MKLTTNTGFCISLAAAVQLAGAIQLDVTNTGNFSKNVLYRRRS
jgi:hypothetical protein